MSNLHVDGVKEMINKFYPGWAGFGDQRFVSDEVEYKQATVRKVKKQISQPALQAMIDSGQFDEAIEIVKKLGWGNNLLWRSVPLEGDLNVLHQRSLDKEEFLKAFRDLLYSEGTAEERLDAYSRYAEGADLPNKWTFPTYFLFFTHPETELFIKPRATKWFLDSVGSNTNLGSHPNGAVYGEVKRILKQTGEALDSDGIRDMIDLQSLLWVAYSASRQRSQELGYPFAEMFSGMEEAGWAFDLLLEVAEMLGLDGPEDPLAAYTLQKRGAEYWLHFDYGNWLTLGFAGGNKRLSQLDGPLFLAPEGMTQLYDSAFTVGPDERQVHLFGFPIGEVRERIDEVSALIHECLPYLRERFDGWRRSPYRDSNIPQLAKAVFDDDERERLLREGYRGDVGKSIKEVPPQIEIGLLADENEGDLAAQPIISLGRLAEFTGIDESRLQSWVRAIERKGQAIFYGPPGTGKTFLAKKLAQHIIGGTDGFVDFVQFHPAYAYEDFIQGIRPQTDESGGLSYPVVPGRFLKFCGLASHRKGECVLIIDEINRANLARVFGEMMYLLEYRDSDIPLAAGERFAIPGNVRIIGTMNTADRSIALVDHALRRRFAFLRLQPEVEILRRYHERNNTNFNLQGLIQVIKGVNNAIDDPNYSLGITFFLHQDLSEEILEIWKLEIEPYLEEYFFDKPSRVDEFRWEKVRATILGD